MSHLEQFPHSPSPRACSSASMVTRRRCSTHPPPPPVACPWPSLSPCTLPLSPFGPPGPHSLPLQGSTAQLQLFPFGNIRRDCLQKLGCNPGGSRQA